MNTHTPDAQMRVPAPQRRQTLAVDLGHGAVIGGNNPVVVQSMTNTPTLDTEACVDQISRLADAGTRLVRLTAQGVAHAANLANIRKELEARGIDVALAADIHFNPAAAFEAAKHVNKVRINPGNFADPGRTFKHIEYDDATYASELDRIADAFRPLLKECREHGTALRIGVNHGSLSDRIMSRFGNTPAGMAESAMEYLRIAHAEGFDRIVVSLKASNMRVMVDAVRATVAAMDSEDMHYPLHLGVTEAGAGEDGRVRSAMGIGALMAEGLGDTIRVSLSEDPVAEIPVAQALTEYVSNMLPLPEVDADGLLTLAYPADMDADMVTVAAATDLGRIVYAPGQHPRDIREVRVIAPALSDADAKTLADTLMQASGIRIIRPDYIACPGCGRTLFDLPEALARVRQATSHLRGLKIAVMGCVVNGPGEMADADYGYVGGARGRVSLYRRLECVASNLTPDEALERLVEIIREDGQTDKE